MECRRRLHENMTMPALNNVRHEKFVQAIIAQNMSATAAYKSVYGDDKSENTVNASASRLVRFSKVAARLAELREKAAEKFEITVDGMIKDFAQDARDAKNDKQHGAVIAARTAMAKLAGLWVERAENLNGNYAISDAPHTEQEWLDRHVNPPSQGATAGKAGDGH
jgi:hypothetical protein